MGSRALLSQWRLGLSVLDSLCAEAKAASGVNDAFRGKVRKWIQQIGRHEARETRWFRMPLAGISPPKISFVAW